MFIAHVGYITLFKLLFSVSGVSATTTTTPMAVVCTDAFTATMTVIIASTSMG